MKISQFRCWLLRAAGWGWRAAGWGCPLALTALLWLSTLQKGMGAANDPMLDPTGMVDPLMDDSGEFVVAWHTWGVTHPPGYPLLNALANLITRLFGRLGISPPVAAASLVSWCFGLAALAILAAIVGRVLAQTGGASPDRASSVPAWCAAAAVLLPAFGGLMWLYASVAEVYTFGLCLGLLALWLALDLGDHPRPRRALALGLVFGLAVGHHRTLLLMAPALAWAVWPARRLPMRWWLAAAGLAVASLAVYWYLPWAAHLGSPWLYGRSPGTWDGVLDALLAREYAGQLAPPLGAGEIGAALVGRVAFLAHEMTPLALSLAVLGLILAIRSVPLRRPAVALGLVAAGYLLAPVGQKLLIGTHLPVLVASIALAGGCALGLGALASTHRRWFEAGVLAAFLAAAGAAWTHRPFVLQYTSDRLGERIVAAAHAISAEPGGGLDGSQGRVAGTQTGRQVGPTFAEVWGPRYFALAYGKFVTHAIADVQLVDVREDLSGLPAGGASPDAIYTTQDLLYLIPPDRWASHFGHLPVLESAGDGLVVMRGAPRVVGTATRNPTARLTQPPAMPSLSNGDSNKPPNVPLESAGDSDLVMDALSASWESDEALHVGVLWRALRMPQRDYHVFVHVGRDPAMDKPGAIIAQADRVAPVYGFYPTSRWVTGEQVRDDYRVDPPVGARNWRLNSVSVGLFTVALDWWRPTYAAVGLYTVDPDGQFVNHLRRVVRIGESIP